MPGGAPLKKRRAAASKRPCKYGPRDADGLCPKKPKTPSKPRSSTASKRPCKYGARINGKCPPKPKAAKAKVRELSSVDGAAKQAHTVLRDKAATKSEKKEAVKVLATAVAVDATKKAAADAKRQVKAALKKPETKKAIAKVAKQYGVPVAKAAGLTTAAGAILIGGGAALSANRKREARAFADRELAKSKKRLGSALTAEQAKILWQQYYDHALKQPVYTPTIK